MKHDEKYGGPQPREAVAAARRPSRRVAVAIALFVGALVALGAIFASRGGEGAAQPTAAEVARVHAILHRLDRTCARSRGLPAARKQLDRDVDTILAFTVAYPEARFPIDDESGTALSLLLVTREATRRCAPDASRRFDDALPEQFRTR
jgi:hypothetical protein